jgi:hypothetical protein
MHFTDVMEHVARGFEDAGSDGAGHDVADRAEE